VRITIYNPINISKWRWVVVCPGISDNEINEINEWLDIKHIEYSNVTVRWWLSRETDVNWFILRWS